MLGRLRMVGVPMLKAERISCSGPKLSDAQTRNFEAIKHTRALPYRWGRAGPKLVAFAGEVPQIGRKGNEIWNVLSRPPSQGEKPQLVWNRNVRILTLSIFSLPFRPICGMRVPSSRLVPSFSTHRTHRRRVLL